MKLRTYPWFLLFCLGCLGSSVLTACPDADASLQKWSDPATWNGNLPTENSNLTITKGILLDTSPPELFSIVIGNGGKLVWKSSEDISLRVHYIRVMDQGEMHIGSEDCPYDGNAKITLLGKSRFELDIGFCTEKVLCVDNGGTLELHGKQKLSWTKITNTIQKFGRNNGLLFAFRDGDMPADYNKAQKALVIQQFSNKGVHKSTKAFALGYIQEDDDESISDLQDFLDGVPNNDVLAIATQKDIAKNDLSGLYSAIESVLPPSQQGLSQLRGIQKHDAYALITQKGTNNFHEVRDEYFVGRQTDEEASAELLVGQYYFHAYSFNVNSNKKFKSYVDFLVKKYDVIKMVDDVSSWEPGDKVFIASTDYDMEQTEEATVLPCDSSLCNTPQKILLDLEAKYMHYGKIDMNVDMRAEVGLMTRNIHITSEIEPGQNNGGHVKFLRGFKSVRVEGVEVTNLGDPVELGRYPLHYHMCLDISTKGSYLRGNSLHHNRLRCLTVHGTIGAVVQNNACYNYVGNGYFLEDGGERETTLEGNLAALGYKGDKDNPLIPSDRVPSAFWITNPKTYVRNNAAAGGEGVGFWYVYPVQPTGLTRRIFSGDELDYFFHADEARRTPMYEFDNNVAHSFHKAGLFIDATLQSDGEVNDYNFYEPRVDPLDETSDWKLVNIYRATAYKNRIQNIWVRGGYFRLYRCSVADSRQGVVLPKIGDYEQFFVRSVVLGDSDNKGEPSTVTYKGQTYQFDRSVPHLFTPDYPRQGFVFSHGPLYLDRVFFHGFISNEVYRAGAIAFKLDHDRSSSIRNQGKNIEFGFDDGVGTGNRAYDGNSSTPHFTSINGDLIASYWDRDGTVTGIPDARIMRNLPFQTTSACSYNGHWNLAVCPHQYGQIGGSWDKSAGDMIMTRSDSQSATMTADPELKAKFNLLIEGRHHYFAKFKDGLPIDKKIKFTMTGVDRNTGVRIMLCVPRDTKDFSLAYKLYDDKFTAGTLVASVAEVDSGPFGNYYFDSRIGAIIFRMTHTADWSNDDLKDCPDNKCPEVNIRVRDGTDVDNHCDNRAFNSGNYVTSPITDLPPSPMEDFLKDRSNPAPRWGAGSTRPFVPLDTTN